MGAALKAAVTPLLLRSAAVAALGGFLFGFDTAVISGATDALRLRFALDSNQLGFTVASALIGIVFGSIGAGQPSERYGRRPVLRALAVLYCLTAFGCSLAWNWLWLVMFRFLGGWRSPFTSPFFAFSQGAVIWVFISEIFPNRVRARGQALGSFTHWVWAAVVAGASP